ncbi:hypothetical protein TNCV_1405071 [Trichonephila clavipes]|nr:hypothetical protein TNCV_1405071 [Trichonephila clavipes]
MLQKCSSGKLRLHEAFGDPDHVIFEPWSSDVDDIAGTPLLTTTHQCDGCPAETSGLQGDNSPLKGFTASADAENEGVNEGIAAHSSLSFESLLVTSDRLPRLTKHPIMPDVMDMIGTLTRLFSNDICALRNDAEEINL